MIGVALDESTENLEKLESHGIDAYIDPRLNKELAKIGDINIEYLTNQLGQSGYKITVGNGDCSQSGCRGC